MPVGSKLCCCFAVLVYSTWHWTVVIIIIIIIRGEQHSGRWVLQKQFHRTLKPLSEWYAWTLWCNCMCAVTWNWTFYALLCKTKYTHAASIRISEGELKPGAANQKRSIKWPAASVSTSISTSFGSLLVWNDISNDLKEAPGIARLEPISQHWQRSLTSTKHSRHLPIFQETNIPKNSDCAMQSAKDFTLLCAPKCGCTLRNKCINECLPSVVPTFLRKHVRNW